MLMPPLFQSCPRHSKRPNPDKGESKDAEKHATERKEKRSTRTVRQTPEDRRLSRIPNLATPFHREIAWSSPTFLRPPSPYPHSAIPAAPSLGQLAPQQMLHSVVVPKTCVSFKTFFPRHSFNSFKKSPMGAAALTFLSLKMTRALSKFHSTDASDRHSSA